MNKISYVSIAIASVILPFCINGATDQPPGQPAVKQASQAATGPPSIVLVTVESLRFDILGAREPKRDLTPFLDQFEGGCTKFEKAFASIPETFPSHITIMSGWAPSRHGTFRDEQLCGGEVPLLAKELKNAGYRTAAFVSDIELLNRRGLAQGFETYDDTFFTPKPPQILSRKARDTVAAAKKWLKGSGGDRYFCWIHLADAGQSWSALSNDVVKMEKEAYKAAVRELDAQIGDLLSALAGSGRMENVAVVVCGDHGTAIGDHGEGDHGLFLYDSVARVPLLIKAPGQTARRKIKGAVGLVDIAPTLREIAGLPAQAECDGISLRRSLVEGEEPQQHPIFMESHRPFDRYGWSPLFAVVSGTWKYISAPREELYNLAADAAEIKNLAEVNSTKVKELSSKLLEWKKAMPKARQFAKEILTPEEEDTIRWTGAVPGRGEVRPKKIDPKAPLMDPKDMAGLLKMFVAADYLAADGSVDESMKAVEKLVNQDFFNPTFQYTLGLLYSIPKPFAALKAFRDAIRAMPSFQPAYEKLCEGFFTYEMYDKALAISEMGLRRTADENGHLHYIRAENMAMLKRSPEDVMKDLSTAIARDPELPGAYGLRAAMHLRAGDKEAAYEDLECMNAISTPAMMAALAKDTFLQPIWTEERFKKLVAPSP